MSIRVKLRGDKAIVRFTSQEDKIRFANILRTFRDSTTDSSISIKDESGDEIPRIVNKPTTPAIQVSPEIKKPEEVKS